MRLSDVYGKDAIYNLISGHYFLKSSQKTNDGELFAEEDKLLYKDKNGNNRIVAEDVDEWILRSDLLILYQLQFHDEPTFWITNLIGERLGNGIILKSKELLYTIADKVFLENPSGDKKLIMTLPSDKTPIMFDDDGFYLLQGFPYSDLIYHKCYDKEGNYLSEPTEKAFRQQLMRDLECTFLHWKKLNEATKNSDVPEWKRQIYHSLQELREEPILTYETIDKIIELATKAELIDEFSVTSYRKIEELLHYVGIENELEVPILNIISLNRTGEYGRISTRFSSYRISEMLFKIYRWVGSETFKKILYDPDSLNRVMKMAKQGEFNR